MASNTTPVSRGNATPLMTPNFGYVELMALGAETGSVYDHTSKDMTFGTMLPGGSNYAQTTDKFLDVRHAFGPAANSLTLLFYMTNAANEACGFELYAWKTDAANMIGSMVFECASTALIQGTQSVTKNPIDGSTVTDGDWCDTLSGTSHWLRS